MWVWGGRAPATPQNFCVVCTLDWNPRAWAHDEAVWWPFPGARLLTGVPPPKCHFLLALEGAVVDGMVTAPLAHPDRTPWRTHDVAMRGAIHASVVTTVDALCLHGAPLAYYF